ncbi:MAG TPA: peptidoglycan DD-metalloendopeptidase family protein [Bacteroidota bacterium]|nr:peptidoglycan DD-metalloendopeptidase family protein [Bacteroidota bacterium]
MTRMISIVLLAITVLAAAVSLNGQTREITKKERELQKLRNEIGAYEAKLRDSEKRERSTLERLDDLEQQAVLIKQLVGKLKDEEEQLTKEIGMAKGSIEELERQLQFLKTHYAGYVRSVYKNGRVYDLELLFSSRSINQMYIRIEYLKKFSDQRAEDLRRIVQKKNEVERQDNQLQESLKEERRLLAEKTREESNLKRKTNQRQQVLRQIRKDKKVYRQELTRKTAALKKIEQLIADLIEKERLRREEAKKKREAAAARERERKKEKLATTSVPETPVLDIEPTGTFAQRKGRLRWPVASGVIESRFGNQTHPVLKTVTQNSGVDISVKVGTNVAAVAEGEVSILSFIPGYGNVVILNHYNGFRTVYAHLSEISVVEAQKVGEGDVIGKSGDTIAGSVLHFEIWREREKQNPELWLARQ